MPYATTSLPAEETSPVDRTSMTRDVAGELCHLQGELLRAVSNSADKQSLLSVVSDTLVDAIHPLAVQYCDRDDDQHLAPSWQACAEGADWSPESIRAPLLALSNLACKKGGLQTSCLDPQERVLGISVPVFLRSCPPEALAVAVSRSNAEQSIAPLQLAAAHITMWNMLQDCKQVGADAQVSAGLLEMLAKLGATGRLDEAGYQLANALQQQFQCHRVAIAIGRQGGRRCSLVGLSEHPKFDRNSRYVQSFQSALEATMLRGTLAVWPHGGQVERQATRSEQQVCTQNNSQSVIAAPLEDESGAVVGAWLFLGGEDFGKRPGQLRLIRASGMPVGTWLQLVQRAGRGSVARLAGRVADCRRSWRVKCGLAVACLLTAMLCVPLHYKVKCECQVQPFTHRFVAAPFDGRLDKACVSPGDVVRAGTVLARMEGRDIRWELAGVEADHGQATKRRDAALASHDMVTAQLAKLEGERLELKTKILEDRSLNLEIKSPIDGVVISGDQERAEGAPLATGQSLFEVAPLEKMVVELAVPEDDILHLQRGFPVVIQLDAFPREKWHATIQRIHPRAETWQESHVFIAEVHLDNQTGTLRPGMNGQARIQADRHTLAWNLFHKPWQFFVTAIGF